MTLLADPTTATAGPALLHRPRRLRRTPALRRLVRETRLDAAMLIAPLFVRPGRGVREPIGSMPGQSRLSVDTLVYDAHRLAEAGVGGVLLFGLPEAKDDAGSGAWADAGIVQQALQALRDADLPLVLMADTCLCEYTRHGHCGPIGADGSVENDPALALLARTAVAQAAAGADIVAPSAMMDGQVTAIRAALDAAGQAEVAVMAYAAKAASSFYGPFREAADSVPAFGDRRAYQMDPANAREAMRETALDVAQGADLLLVKPALSRLDLIAAPRERGWIDGRRAMLESLVSVARAGADLLITYAAADVAAWIAEDRA
jgi:porphobilinogen synthase